MKNTTKKGFTLVELLVVIAIIAVLATIILPGMGKIRTKAKNLKCQSNLRALYMGMIEYESQYKTYPRGDQFHGKAFWETLRTLPRLDRSIFADKKNDLFICPIKGTLPAASACDYQGPNFDVSDALEESVAIGADDPKNHDPLNGQKDRNVLYWGGSITNLDFTNDGDEWTSVDTQVQD